MHKAIKTLRKQAQPMLEKLENGEEITQQEFKQASELYELAYYLRKFDDIKPDKDSDEENDLIYRLRDELDGVEEYYNFWIMTKIPEYKMMAQQELSHAEFWAKQIRQAGIPRDQFEDEVIRHAELSDKLK